MAKDRCINPKNKDYKWYGGRGITFELTSFKTFIDEVGVRPEGYTLDRIDSNKPYMHGNLRWATPLEQAHNRRPAPLGETGIRGVYKRPNGFIVNKNGVYHSFHKTVVSVKEAVCL